MSITYKRTISLVAVIIICGAFVSRASGQQATEARAEAPAVVKYDGDMAALLAHLPQIYGTTIGLELDPRKSKSQVKFYLRDPTLPDVLNAIVESAPRYKWRDNNGIIEVLPLEGSTPLLNTTIKRYRISEVDEADAINQLLSQTEVLAGMKALRMNRRSSGNPSIESKAKKISLNLEGVTMRQALNRIAAEGGRGFWIFQTYGDGSFSINAEPR